MPEIRLMRGAGKRAPFQNKVVADVRRGFQFAPKQGFTIFVADQEGRAYEVRLSRPEMMALIGAISSRHAIDAFGAIEAGRWLAMTKEIVLGQGTAGLSPIDEAA